MALVPARKRGRNEMARLHDEMDGLLARFFGDWEWPALAHTHWPALDVAENENNYVVKAEVPGSKADDIDISVHGNVLTLSGEKKEEQEKKEKGYYHVERSYGSFRRDINLGGDVDTAKIEATCKDGVLMVTLRKSEKAKAIKVKIKEQ